MRRIRSGRLILNPPHHFQYLWMWAGLTPDSTLKPLSSGVMIKTTQQHIRIEWQCQTLHYKSRFDASGYDMFLNGKVSIDEFIVTVELTLQSNRTKYRNAVSHVGDTRHKRHIPDFLRYFVYVVVLLQVKVGHNRRGEADNSDACLVVDDLESADDVCRELLDDEPVQFPNARGRVENEDNVNATVPNHCERQ